MVMIHLSRGNHMEKKFDKVKYVNEWKRKNVKRYNLQFNTKTDAKVIKKLDEQDNRNEYIRGLVLKDMEKKK